MLLYNILSSSLNHLMILIFMKIIDNPILIDVNSSEEK